MSSTFLTPASSLPPKACSQKRPLEANRSPIAWTGCGVSLEQLWLTGFPRFSLTLSCTCYGRACGRQMISRSASAPQLRYPRTTGLQRMLPSTVRSRPPSMSRPVSGSDIDNFRCSKTIGGRSTNGHLLRASLGLVGLQPTVWSFRRESNPQTQGVCLLLNP